MILHWKLRYIHWNWRYYIFKSTHLTLRLLQLRAKFQRHICPRQTRCRRECASPYQWSPASCTWWRLAEDGRNLTFLGRRRANVLPVANSIWCFQSFLGWCMENIKLVRGWATPLKNISQLGWLFPIYGKIKNVPNHQPENHGSYCSYFR